MTPHLVVRHAITSDDVYGEPWPPNEPGLWVHVTRLPTEFSLWRQINVEITSDVAVSS